MTVQELIDILKKFDPSDVIYVRAGHIRLTKGRTLEVVRADIDELLTIFTRPRRRRGSMYNG